MDFIFFRAAKVRGRYRNFPYIPYQHIRVASPIIHPPQRGGRWVTTDEPTLTYLITHKNPHLTLGFTLNAVHPMGLDKFIRTCMHHYSIIQSSFTALKILCILPNHAPPHLPTPRNHYLFTVSTNFAFSRMWYAALSDWLLSLSNMYVRCSPHIFSWFDSSFLFSAEEDSIVRMYHSVLIIHLLKDILTASNFWQLQMKSL